MASSGKKKTTMAKLARESRLRERRVEKAARKRARKDAPTNPSSAFEDFSSSAYEDFSAANPSAEDPPTTTTEAPRHTAD
jgi:hypothetical protein